MPDQPIAAGSDELEAAISGLRGVLGCRVYRLEDGEIEAIHILAEGNRPAKQIVRDVETICSTRFGVHVDHRKISIARLAEDSFEEEPGEPLPLLLHSLQVVSGHGILEVAVRLRRGERIFEGRARGAGGEKASRRACAEATLAAVAEALGGTCYLNYRDSILHPVGSLQAIVVALSVVTGEVEQKLLGAHLEGEDLSSGTVKAVLQAVNRHIQLTRGDEVELWDLGDGGSRAPRGTPP